MPVGFPLIRAWLRAVDDGMHLAFRQGMSTSLRVLISVVAALALSACGGLGKLEPASPITTGGTSEPGTIGTTSSGGTIASSAHGTGGATGGGAGGAPTGGGASGTGAGRGTGGVGSGGTTTTATTVVHAADAGMPVFGGAGSSAGPVPPMIPGGGAASDPTGGPTSTTTPGIDGGTQLMAGQMTAGTWDDNLNFSFYATYLGAEAEAQLAGLPVIPRGDRMVILVKSADAQPVAGVLVTVADTQDHVWTSTTGAEGRVLYFPAWAGVAPGAALGITATLGTLSATATATAAAGTVEIDLAQTALPQVAALDLAFLIDTTGSMGDELSYLRRELDNIVGGIATQFPGFAQRFALVLYRDTADEYVVRSFDFTTDLPTFRAQLAAQSANGGDDMPEAVDQGLAAATELSWSDGAVARVAFWIADAPHHAGLEAKVVTALSAAVRKAVHLYPVAASGIDDLGEFTMRTAAEVTGGRYLFLTNDSGIGGSHAEPHIPCYYVTTLAAAMRRMVATELIGSYLPPDPADILRTSGEPQNQQCTLADGTPVTAW
jgi:hypothetical protein